MRSICAALRPNDFAALRHLAVTVPISAASVRARAGLMPNSAATRSMEYLTLADAADRMGVSTATVRRRITDGRLGAYRLGDRLIRIRAADLEQMLTEIPNVRTARRRSRWG